MAQLALAFDILARDRASKTFKDVGDSAERAGKKGDGFGRAMSGGMALAGKAVAAGSAAIITGLGVSIKKTMDFDKTMRTVGATLGASGPVQKELTALAIKLGKETVFGAGDASEAMLELAKGGMTAAQIKAGALSSTLTLATAGSLDLGNAATFVSNGLNTFGLKASDANKVAAALAGGANASSASVESLGLALSQVGPGARTAGLSIQETTAVLAAFDNAGIKGSDAGTSLKTMLTRLVPEGKKATNMMHDLGLQFTDSKGAFLPIAQVAEQLKDKLSGLSAEQKTVALRTIFGSDATRAATVLMSLGAKGVEKYTKATSDQAAAQRMAKTATEGAAGAWEAFQGSLETIAITLGQKLLPVFTRLVSGANNIAGVVLEKMGPAFDAVTGTVELFIGAITGNGADVELPWMNAVIDAGAGVRSAFDRMRGTFANIVKIGGHVGAVFVLIKDEIVDLIGEFQNGVGAGGTLRNALSKVGDVVQAVTKWLADHGTIVGSVTAAILGGVVAFKAITTAVKIYTVAQGILNAVLTANPIGIVIVAIAALAAGFIYAYKTSETFRNIVNTVFSVVKVSALNLAKVAVTAFQFMANIWMEVVHTLLVGAAKAFGWVPGIGPKLEGAAREFGKFKDSANAKLDAIKDSIDIQLKTEEASRQLEALHREFKSKGWTITAEARTNLVYLGNGQYGTGGGSGGGEGGGLGRPVPNPIGTGYGGYPGHKGVDFLTPFGTPVRAAMSGTVTRDGWDTGGFGVHVRTRDVDGNYTILGHLSKEIVSVGQRIAKGQLIGYSGSTGNSSGPHLHMERRHGPGPGSAYNFTSALPRNRGGEVRSGGLYAVGDNPDGSWNKTTELFRPSTPGHIITQAQAASAASNRGGAVESAGRSLTDEDVLLIAAAVESGARRGVGDSSALARLHGRMERGAR